MIEPLETRIAPAVLTGKVLTYTDVDGDAVTVTFKTKAVLAEANFTFNNAFATAGAQSLQLINLSTDPLNDGASITVKVTPQPPVGDGKVNIGYINATGSDLKAVIIPGDLGQIDCGDAKADPGLGKLTLDSLGALGLTTQAAGGSLASLVIGPLKSLAIAGDLAGNLRVLNIGGKTKGLLGKAVIGGDLDGASQNLGMLSAEGDIGSVLIKGTIIGGAVNGTGTIDADDKIGKVTVGLRPAPGAPPPTGVVMTGVAQDSGSITCGDTMGTITIYGSVLGGAGSQSGNIQSGGSSIKKVFITGDVTGNGARSGRIEADAIIKSATILGNLQGGAGDGSGFIEGVDGIGKIKIGGSVIGSGPNSGFIEADGPFKSIEIGGNLIGGAGINSGGIYGIGIGKILIKGGITSGTGAHSGNIDSDTFLGSVTINGDVTGTAAHNVVIIAKSAAKPGKADIAIKSVKIGGSATFLDILAGYNGSTASDIQPLVDGNAGIGAVTITGAVSGVNIAAGVDPVDGIFGNGNDVTPGAFAAKPFATIGKIVVTGAITATADGSDFFAFTAQLIKSASITGVKQKLTKANGNDSIAFSDILLKEVA